MTNEMETKVCNYCGWVFKITPRHRSERVLPYCSHGCRIACEERHVAFEERHCELKEEIISSELPADFAPDLDTVADLSPEVTDKLREFFRQWVRLSEDTRECVASRLSGARYWTIGELRGISKQAAHKSAIKAARRDPVLAKALNLEKENATLNPPPPVEFALSTVSVTVDAPSSRVAQQVAFDL